MRPLTADETKTFFEKLSRYIGENIRLLLERPDDIYCFRLHKDRIYYMPEKLMKNALSFPQASLVCAGICFGKFTKSGKCHLHVTALEYMAPYAQHKVWLKPSAEQQFLYGHHALKSGLARITESTDKYDGVIVYSMKDTPLGFGASAKSTAECRHCDPTAIVVFHQADIGQYLRNEQTLI